MRGEKALCIIAIILLMATLYITTKATLNDRYTTEAVVIEVSEHIISAEDSIGNVWCYEVKGDTVPQVGTEVVLTMMAMGSDTIYDDRVVDVGQG